MKKNSPSSPTGNGQVSHRKALKMKAAVLVSPGKFETREIPLPEPGEREVRVRIESCGVCASNIPPYEGRPWFEYPLQPGALGHEACGWIDALGPKASKRWGIGQRVALLSQHAYAEYDTVSDQAIVALPDSLKKEQVPAEPVACAINIFKRSGIKAGDTVAIVGVGFLGALLIQLAASAGAEVIALSRRSSALSIGRSCGATGVVSLECPETALLQIKQMTRDVLCDVVIEATGKQAPLSLASEITKERGRLIIAGYHQDGGRQINMQLWNWRGLDVINAHERDPEIYVRGMREGVEALAEGRLFITPLLTHHLPLEDLGSALEMTRDRPDGFMKALIRLQKAQIA
jgi:threonine dehydrogenase-like Zn-dependent dehydrogenase